jgi:hypothetical protein
VDGAQTGGRWLTAPAGVFPAGPVDGGVGTLGAGRTARRWTTGAEPSPAAGRCRRRVPDDIAERMGECDPCTAQRRDRHSKRCLCSARRSLVELAPTSVPPLLVGARGQKTLALAGQIADGLVLDAGLSPDGVRAAVATAAAARRQEVVVYLPCGAGHGARQRLEAELDPNHYPRCSRLTIYHASLRVADLDAEPGNVCTAGR